jgi:hypothetical protein
MCMYVLVYAQEYARRAQVRLFVRLSVMLWCWSLCSTYSNSNHYILFFSKRRPLQRRVVSWPDNGPRVDSDVKQGAAHPLQPRPPVAVASAPWKTGVRTVHNSKNPCVCDDTHLENLVDPATVGVAQSSIDWLKAAHIL